MCIIFINIFILSQVILGGDSGDLLWDFFFNYLFLYVWSFHLNMCQFNISAKNVFRDSEKHDISMYLTISD